MLGRGLSGTASLIAAACQALGCAADAGGSAGQEPADPSPATTSGTAAATVWSPSSEEGGSTSGGGLESTGPQEELTGSTSGGTQPIPDGPRMLEEFQALATSNAADFEAFEIDATTYLAVANYSGEEGFNIDSEIFRWDGEAFVSFQRIATSGAYAFEAFGAGGGQYLGVANYFDGATFDIDSQIYRFESAQFVPFQSIATQGAFDVEAFALGAETWLAIANEVSLADDLQYDQTSRLYRLEGETFAPFQGLPTHGAHDITHFRIGATDYLGVAQYYQDGFATPTSYQPPSELYRWHSSTVGFAAWTSVPGLGAFDWEFFEIDGEAFGFLCNSIDGVTFDVDSVLYDVGPDGFTERQRIPTHDATAAAAFEVGGEHYLAVANAATGDNVTSSFAVDSVVYRWVDGTFVEHQSLPTLGAYDVEPFSIGRRYFLAVANSNDGVTVAQDSMVYELVPP